MRYLLFILILFSGCTAEWHVQRALDKDPDVINTKADTVTTIDVSFKDTVLYFEKKQPIKLVSDTVTKTVFTDNEKNFSVETQTKDSVATAKAVMEGGKLSLSVFYSLDTVVVLNDSIKTQIKTIDSLKEITRESKATIKEKETLLKKIQRWGIIIIIVLVLGLIIYKIL